MTFQQSIQTCLNKYVDFSGRASRSEFWWFSLFIFLVALVAGFIGSMISQTVYYVLATIVYLAFLLPGLAVTVRRLHDTGKSGWWVFISLIPVIGGIWLLVLELTAGSPNPNQYGAPVTDYENLK